MGASNYRHIVFFVFCVIHVLLSIACSSFLPQDKIFIDCGGTKPLELNDGVRVFEPDSGNNPHLSAPKNSVVVVNNDVVSDPQMTAASASNDMNLYNSARVFRETSAYTIHTKQSGRHWLRLHFYPVKNHLYDLRSAVFSVVANEITLLHRFSFSNSENIIPLFKEYVVDLSSKKSLVLKLCPLMKGSVAFINGIELVSVPSNQFPSTALPIPMGTSVEILSHIAFETVYRVNMGGPVITPKNDSLWRTWETDEPFLLNAASARNVSKNPSLVKYPDGVSVEIAPNWVYATAQEMADANVVNQKFNISWGFQVQNGFSYLIRMHFCDIVSVAVETLVFNVYINEQTALDTFDISSRTMELLSAAYFVDFVANIPSGSDRILVQVGPSDLPSFPSNAILNGLEIMKMSNPIGSLDGNFAANDIDSNSKSQHNKRAMLVLTVSLASFGFVGVLVLFFSAFFFFSGRRQTNRKNPKRQCSSWLSFPNHFGISESKISIGSSASTANSVGLGRVLAFSEIRDATNNFDESLVLGVGGFGKVYKGVLQNGPNTIVAVKRGNPRSQQGLTEFRTEIQMLTKLRHRHLVSLIGYCEELNEMILVYEFMAGGPLRKHLYGPESELSPRRLTWKQRLEICIGAAKGLHYLHTGASDVVIHRDVKTTNILLDENLTAKVADFGLSKLGPTLDQTHVSTAVKGSFGYLDPEYYRRQQLTEKSDVYSFGVVLMEVLCARPAINPALPREQVNIAEWAMNWQKKGRLEKIVDPHLVGSVNPESLRKFGETAQKCLAEYGAERPTMGDVLWNLEYALQLQEASVQILSPENSTSCIPNVPAWLPGTENEEFTSDAQESDATSSAVFSQLMDPKGR